MGGASHRPLTVGSAATCAPCREELPTPCAVPRIPSNNGGMVSRPWLRWLVPIAAILAVVATTLVAGNASADEKLPPRSAEQLLVDLQQADVHGFSGTVDQSADLGIPALPGVSEHGSEFSSLISGTHTLRVAVRRPRLFEGLSAGRPVRVLGDPARRRRLDLVQQGQRGHPRHGRSPTRRPRIDRRTCPPTHRRRRRKLLRRSSRPAPTAPTCRWPPTPPSPAGRRTSWCCDPRTSAR